MNLRPEPAFRYLAIDPTPKGLGFAVLEGDELIDWGLCQVRTEKNAGAIARVAQLLRRFHPDKLILEDHRARGSRRQSRIQQLLGRVAAVAAAAGASVALVSAVAVRRTFASFEANNKDQVARKIVEWFPELAPRLPKPRKPWMSEDERMGIFDALALICAYLGKCGAGIGRR